MRLWPNTPGMWMHSLSIISAIAVSAQSSTELDWVTALLIVVGPNFSLSKVHVPFLAAPARSERVEHLPETNDSLSGVQFSSCKTAQRIYSSTDRCCLPGRRNEMLEKFPPNSNATIQSNKNWIQHTSSAIFSSEWNLTWGHLLGLWPHLAHPPGVYTTTRLPLVNTSYKPVHKYILWR